MNINRIYNEDCLETMKRMPDDFVDYCLTSPPYNIGYNQMNGRNSRKYKDTDDNLGDEQYFKWTCQIIDEMLRITKKHIFYNIQMLGGNKISVLNLIGKYANKIKDIIIWDKKMIPHIEHGVLSSQFEFIIIFSNDYPDKKKFYDGNFKGNFSNVIKIKNIHHNNYSDIHRAVMPLDIPRIIMTKFGSVNDIWYDSFIGSGTTPIAAIEEKRRYIGSEIDKDYYDAALKRIKEQTAQIRMEI